ncbi:MAG: phage tail tape measure protein [Bacteroidota bacterium]
MALDVSVHLRMLDALTAPANKAAEALGRLKNAVKSVATGSDTASIQRLSQSYDRLAQSAERASARLASLRGKALAVAAGAFTLSAPVKNAADFQLNMLRLLQVDEWQDKVEEAYQKAGKALPELFRKGNKGTIDGLTSEGKRLLDEYMATNTKLVDQIGRESVQSSNSVLQALTTMVARGVGEGSVLKDVGQAIGLIRAAGRTATASGADFNDLAKAGYAFLENFGISPESAALAYDIMHKGGKIGGVEIADQARWLPRLGAPLGGLMQTRWKELQRIHSPGLYERFKNEEALDLLGNTVGYMQIALKGAADPDEAANNLANVIQKTFINETAEHFAKHAKLADFAGLAAYGINYLDFVKEDKKGGKQFDFFKYIEAQTRAGVDPWLAQMRLSSVLAQAMGSNLIIGKLWNDRQAMQGMFILTSKYQEYIDRRNADVRSGKLSPDSNPEVYWNRYRKQIRDARGTIDRDFGSAVETLTIKFRRLTFTLERLVRMFTTGGLMGPMTSFFDLIGSWALKLEDLGIANPNLVNALATGASYVMTAVAGLVLMRFAVSGLQFVFARAGMAGIGLMRIIPGLVPLLGVFGSALGPLAKLGLLGVGGLLLWSHWDKIAPRANDLLGGFGSRLQTMMPGTVSWLTDVALPKLRDWFGMTADAARMLGEQLRQLAVNSYEALRFLFTGQGSAISGQAAKESFLGLFGSVRESVPAFKSLEEWWEKYRRQLTFQEGWKNGFMAWLKTLGVGAGVFATWAVGTHGIAGFLLILAAARSVLFVIGTLLAALNVLATMFNIVLAPLLETLMESKWAQALGAALARGLGFALGGLGLSWYMFGWEGTRDLFAGIYDRFAAEVAGPWANLKERFNELWTTLFGIETEAELQARIDRYKEWGTILGGWVAYGLQQVADAIEALSNAIQRFKVAHPDLTDFLTGWGGELLKWSIAIGIATASFNGLRKVLAGVVDLLLMVTGLGAVWGLIFGRGERAGLLSRLGTIGKWAGAGAAAGWASRGAIVGRLVGMGLPLPLALALAGALGFGAWARSSGDTGDLTGRGVGTGPFGEALDKYMMSAYRDSYKPDVLSPNAVAGPLLKAGDDVAGGVQGAGANIVNALNYVASIIANAASSLLSASRGGDFAARSAGALSDGPSDSLGRFGRN